METNNKKQSENKEALASSIFFAVFFFAIAAAVTFTFCKYFILRDYDITAEADCDPESEKCFIWECDPEASDESEKCTGDPETDIWYYKIIKKNASLIPACDSALEECETLSCLIGEDCEETLCEDGNEEKIECNDPAKYLEEMEALESEEDECGGETEDCAEESEDDTQEETGEMEEIDETNESEDGGAKVQKGNLNDGIEEGSRVYL